MLSSSSSRAHAPPTSHHRGFSFSWLTHKLGDVRGSICPTKCDTSHTGGPRRTKAEESRALANFAQTSPREQPWLSARTPVAVTYMSSSKLMWLDT